jgi:tetratricopeptide (TPR) repeat protein
LHSQPPRITLFHSENLKVTYVPTGAVDRLVVTFASWVETPEKERSGFAQEFLIHRGISAVHVTCAGNDWYQYPEMDEALAAAQRARLSFERCYTYGLSMGGYAAIRFSSLVGAETAIAVSPQFAIDPRQPPFDTRWAMDAARIRFIHGDPWTGVRARVVAIYDNRGIDLRHIMLYRRFVRLFEIGLPYSGHNPARFLVDLGLFQNLIAGLLGDRFDAAQFRHTFREKRKTSAAYFFNLSRAARHLPRALALIDRALQLKPRHPHYIAARANTLLSMGRPVEAEAALRAGIGFVPEESWLHHTLAIALRRQGRLDNAVQEVELAIRLAPTEPEHRALLARMTAPFALRADSV